MEVENDQVCVLGVKVPPYGKLAMHQDPANVLVAITDSEVKDTFPDGKTTQDYGAPLQSWTDSMAPGGKSVQISNSAGFDSGARELLK